VVETDKPAFGILGDPINVAASLQSAHLPGKIQISDGTHSLISAPDFPMEYRGEVDVVGGVCSFPTGICVSTSLHEIDQYVGWNIMGEIV
jgi:hypothetical protein